MCAWYRPPAAGDASTVVTFGQEWKSLKDQALGTLVVGDLNVHQLRWLIHSQRNTPEGNALESFCTCNGFRQLVREPTRGSNLRNLVLTDLPDVACAVQPGPADHKRVTVTLRQRVPKQQQYRRAVWRFKRRLD